MLFNAPSQGLKPSFIALTLCVVGAASHLMPHPAGMSTIGAVGLLAAAYLPRHLLPLPVIASVAAADAVIGAYSTAAMALVYIAHIACAAGVTPLLRKIGPLQVGGAAVVSAVIFYLISNAAPMATGFYQHLGRLAQLLCGRDPLFAAKHCRQSDLWGRCLQQHPRLMVDASTLGTCA